MIELEETLEALGINRDQLIDIAICVGTDYNKGLEKVGPKTALKLIKKNTGTFMPCSGRKGWRLKLWTI